MNPDPRLAELARTVAHELADQLADDVDRAARERAVARVRERLVSDYADAIENALLDELARRHAPPAVPSDAAEASSAPDPSDDRVGWYLYALVDRPDPALAGQPGLDPDHPVEAVGRDGAVAVGSSVRLSLLEAGQQGADLSSEGWLAGALQRHERIVEHAGATVVPMRFGTVYPSRDDVCRLLDGNREPVRSELARLAGRAEWGVKLMRTRAPRSATAPPTNDSVPDGAGYLRAKAESRSRAVAAQEAERSLLAVAHHRLAAVADEATATPVQRSAGPGPVPLLNASFLVAEERLPAFEHAVAALADDCRTADVEVHVTGPWPPYHFTRLQLAEAGPDG